jgi:hypothetical protein
VIRGLTPLTPQNADDEEEKGYDTEPTQSDIRAELETEPATTSGNTNRKRKTAVEKLKDSLSANEVVMQDGKRGRRN